MKRFSYFYVLCFYAIVTPATVGIFLKTYYACAQDFNTHAHMDFQQMNSSISPLLVNHIGNAAMKVLLALLYLELAILKER